MLSFPRAVHSNSYNWMVGAITTVVGEHNRPRAHEAGRIIFDILRLNTESIRGSIDVHGNHLIRLRALISPIPEFNDD